MTLRIILQADGDLSAQAYIAKVALKSGKPADCFWRIYGYGDDTYIAYWSRTQQTITIHPQTRSEQPTT